MGVIIPPWRLKCKTGDSSMLEFSKTTCYYPDR
jgi:hypothetical protein